jgi:hypothetical protein
MGTLFNFAQNSPLPEVASHLNNARRDVSVDLFDRIRIEPTCFLGEDRACSDADACAAHALWKQVRSVYLHFLQSTTLADIAHGGPPVGKRATRPKKMRGSCS